MRFRHGIVIGAALALLSGRASAQGVPDPSHSTIPTCIALVGRDALGAASPAGEFVITVRDLANNPIPGATVTIDFGPVTDAAFCASQPDAALTVDCANDRVSKVTDLLGQVRFNLVGRSTGAYSPGDTGSRAEVYLNGVLLGRVLVTAYDLDGSGRIGSGDLTVWLDQFVLGDGSNACDLDCSGYIGAIDLSRWLAGFADPTQLDFGGVLCP